MRKIIKLFLGIVSIFSFFGCFENEDGGDVPHQFNVSFYKNGK